MLFTYVDLYITIFRNCNCSFYFVIEDLISSAINEERTRNCYLLIFFLFKEKWINKFSAPRMETKHNGNTHQGKIYKGEVGGPLSLNQNRSSGLSEKVGRQSTQSTRSTPTINRGWINCESFHRSFSRFVPFYIFTRDELGNKGKTTILFCGPARAWARQLTDHSVAGYRSVTRPIFLFSFFPARGCRHVLFWACTATISQPSRYTGRCSLKFFPCSRERYPHETCVDAFLKPPHNWAGRGQAVEKRAKGRRLRASMTRRWKKCGKRRNEGEKRNAEFRTFGICERSN